MHVRQKEHYPKCVLIVVWVLNCHTSQIPTSGANKVAFGRLYRWKVDIRAALLYTA